MPGRVAAPFELRTLTLGADRRFQFGSAMVLNASVSADYNTSDITTLPYEIALIDPLGWSEAVTVGLDRMLGSRLVLSGNYVLTKRADRALEQTFSASLRAYF